MPPGSASGASLPGEWEKERRAWQCLSSARFRFLTEEERTHCLSSTSTCQMLRKVPWASLRPMRHHGLRLSAGETGAQRSTVTWLGTGSRKRRLGLSASVPAPTSVQTLLVARTASPPGALGGSCLPLFPQPLRRARHTGGASYMPMAGPFRGLMDPCLLNVTAFMELEQLCHLGPFPPAGPLG